MSEAEPPMPAGGLVHHDPRVRQGVALALGAGAEQELAHRGGQAHADRGDVVGDVVHGVVDRHAGVDRAAGAVDVQEDVGLGVLGARAAAAGRRSRWRSGRAPRSRGRRSAPGAAAGRCGRRGRTPSRRRSSGVVGHVPDPSRKDRTLPRAVPACSPTAHAATRCGHPRTRPWPGGEPPGHALNDARGPLTLGAVRLCDHRSVALARPGCPSRCPAG